MESNRLIELTKKVIRKAGEIGLDAAGGYVCGPAWPYARRILSPVVEELGKRDPKLFLVPEEATKAAEALSDDKILQELLETGFAELETGQEQILAALVRQDATVIQIGDAVKTGFRAAGKKVDDAYDNISHELKALRLELTELRAIHGRVEPIPHSVSGLSMGEIAARANDCQCDAMRSVETRQPNEATRRLTEARSLLKVGLQQEPGNVSLLTIFGFVEKTQAQVAQLLADHEGYVTSLAEATKYFAQAVRHNPKDAGALNGMANIYAFHGIYDQAIQLGTLALRIEPNYGAAAWDLALSLEAKVKEEGPKPVLIDHLKSLYSRLEQLIPRQPRAFSENDLLYVQKRLSALKRSGKPRSKKK
jgi:tetratricopeptide (TPR) repeat protein